MFIALIGDRKKVRILEKLFLIQAIVKMYESEKVISRLGDRRMIQVLDNIYCSNKRPQKKYRFWKSNSFLQGDRRKIRVLDKRVPSYWATIKRYGSQKSSLLTTPCYSSKRPQKCTSLRYVKPTILNCFTIFKCKLFQVCSFIICINIFMHHINCISKQDSFFQKKKKEEGIHFPTKIIQCICMIKIYVSIYL